VNETTDALYKKYREAGYTSHRNQPLTLFPSNVGFNDGLSSAQPDIIEGLNQTRFGSVPFERPTFGGAAVLWEHSEALSFPHLAGEIKGPGKNLIQAEY
jgi:hypothetical protein